MNAPRTVPSEFDLPDDNGRGRAPRKLATRRAMRAAARRLVIDRGLRNVTVQDITRAAQVSKRTFANYFDSKEGAVVDAPPGAPEAMAAMLAERPIGEPGLESLRAVWVDFHTAIVDDMHDLVIIMANNPELAGRHDSAYAPFHDVIVGWAARRYQLDAAVSIYPELLAVVGGATIHLTWKHWDPASGVPGLTRVINEVFAEVAAKLASPPPVRLDAVPAPLAPLDRTELRSLGTRRALQTTARRLVIERGLRDVTVKDITDAANLGKRTFAYHFDSKESAVIDAPPGAAAMLAAMLADRPADEPALESLRVVWVDFFTALAPDLDDLVVIMANNPELAVRHTASFAPFHKVIVDWAVTRYGIDPTGSVYPDLLALVSGATAQLTWKRWTPEQGHDALTALITTIFTAFGTGLADP